MLLGKQGGAGFQLLLGPERFLCSQQPTKFAEDSPECGGGGGMRVVSMMGSVLANPFSPQGIGTSPALFQSSRAELERGWISLCYRALGTWGIECPFRAVTINSC